MPESAYLAGLLPGASVTATLLVTAVESRSYGHGKECILLSLRNASGTIDSSPFWGERRSAVAGVVRGGVVEVTGRIQEFRGRRQLEISRLRPVPAAEADPGALLPFAGNPAPRWERLDQWRAAVRRPRLARVLALFYEDPEFRRRYGQCPGSTVGHHAQIGGLLRHTCEVAAIGLAIAESCGADADLVLAGALLHDIGKLEAYRWDTGFETTHAGALVGHVALGLLMLSRRLAEADPPPCTDSELLLLLHLIASHHGTLAYGATAPPMTLEAEVLHFADDASAKTGSMADVLGDAGNFTGDELLTTRTMWRLDGRRAFRGTSDWGAKKERPPSRG